MRNTGSVAALLAALVVVCAVVALEWYSHVGRPGTSAPAPVQAVTAAPPAPVAGTPQPTQAPVVYVPVAPTASASPQPSVRPSGAIEIPTPATAAPLNAGPTPVVQAPLATLAPTTIMPPIVRVPPNAPPRILAMSLSSPVAHGGEIVSGTVETSSNVASVEARIGGYGAAMQKIGVGRFRLAYRVPRLPFFLRRTYTNQIISRNTRGDAVTTSVPITVR